MRFVFQCLWFGVLHCQCWAVVLNSVVHKEMLQRLQFPEYVASILPSANGVPVEVEVDLFLNSVGPLNEMDMTWKVSFYLRQEWIDRRLMLEGVDSMVKLGEDSIQKLWQPDLFFSNSKDGVRHVLTVPNRLVYINASTGRVLSSQRLTVELHCAMDLVRFPHDNQTCSLMLESYSYSTEELALKWSSKGEILNLHPTVYIPDFHIIDISTSQCTRSYSTGTFPCLQAKVEMHREVGFYMFHTYLPTVLIVILSWASFWIDHDAVPARVSVGLLTVLTITTHLSGSRAQLPRLPYIKAIDVWMSTNLVFVFAAYMEYAVVCVLSRKYKKAFAGKRLEPVEKDTQELLVIQTPTPTHRQSASSPLSPTSEGHTTSSNKSNSGSTSKESGQQPPCPAVMTAPSPGVDTSSGEGYDRGRMLDKKCRVLFPVAFAFFNVVYWVYYLVMV